jgi:hypothetical protein
MELHDPTAEIASLNVYFIISQFLSLISLVQPIGNVRNPAKTHDDPDTLKKRMSFLGAMSQLYTDSGVGVNFRESLKPKALLLSGP